MVGDDAPRPSRLGRGLAALIGDVAADETAPRSSQRVVPVGAILPNPLNPRRDFDDAELEDLANSIREKGVLQPLVIRPDPIRPGSYLLIAGERRWRAAQIAGRHEVPVVVLEVSDREALELAIIENVQRADLNPLEEAAGYEELMARFGYGAAELAKAVGKSRSHVANMVRLIKLPETVKARVRAGELTAGHARALLTARDPEAVAQRAVALGWNVRDVERHVQKEATAKAQPPAAPETKDADTAALERLLGDVTGLAVTIKHGTRGGRISFRYRTLDELDALCQRLRGPQPVRSL